MHKYSEKSDQRPHHIAGKSSERRQFTFLRNMARQAMAMNFFYILSGAAQVMLGAIVTMAAILNLIQPIWLGAFLSLLGCVVTMLGVYQIYDVFNKRRSVADLARDAIERAIQDKN